MKCFPWVSLMVAGVVFVLGISAGEPALVHAGGYQRSAILDGELWRLFSGHLAHYTLQHMWSNLLAFAAMAAVVENLVGHAAMAKVLLALALFISICLLLFVPGMETYAGLSSINYGLLGMLMWRQVSRSRNIVALSASRFFVAAGSAMAVLCWWQAHADSSPFSGELSGVRIAWQAHVAGMSAAALFAAQRHNCLRFPWTCS